MMKLQEIIFITGPTAIGKSETAVLLAKKIDAEIISCDSMQIYKGMDILVSKPGTELLKGVTHHLISMISPVKEYNVSAYRRQALKEIKRITGKNKVTLFVGGTGLYMSILVDGIFQIKSENKDIRNKLYQQAEKKGSIYLHKRLAKVDPQAAAKIHPNDTRRIVRALEVFLVTGKPISELQKTRKGLIDEYKVKIFCLDMPREQLYQRIDARVEKMFRQGLVDEVRRLLKRKLSRTARFAIGIRELEGFFNGAYDLAEAKRLIQRNSRQYAKRQLTWFRKDKRIEWINIDEKDKPDKISDRILKILKN